MLSLLDSTGNSLYSKICTPGTIQFRFADEWTAAILKDRAQYVGFCDADNEVVNNFVPDYLRHTVKHSRKLMAIFLLTTYYKTY